MKTWMETVICLCVCLFLRRVFSGVSYNTLYCNTHTQTDRYTHTHTHTHTLPQELSGLQNSYTGRQLSVRRLQSLILRYEVTEGTHQRNEHLPAHQQTLHPYTKRNLKLYLRAYTHTHTHTHTHTQTHTFANALGVSEF